MFQAKQFYLEQLKDGPVSHRIITWRLKQKFNDSSVLIRNALLEDDLIKLMGSKKRKDGKNDYIYELTGKELVAEEQKPQTEWDDGTARSIGNAFDWRNKSSTLFNKQELAIMHQQYRPTQHMIVYSRA